MKSAIIRKVSLALAIAAAFVAAGTLTPVAAEDSNVQARVPSVGEVYGRGGYWHNASIVASVVRSPSYEEGRTVDKIYGRASYDPYRKAGSGLTVATRVSGKGKRVGTIIYGRSAYDPY